MLFTENHRTGTAYNDSLILKMFLFQFINSYTSLYYMAFWKNGTLPKPAHRTQSPISPNTGNRFWNSHNPDLEDACKNQNAGEQSLIGWGWKSVV